VGDSDDVGRGLVIGRHWAIPLGAIAWAVTLVIAGTIGVADIPLAAALGARMSVGVLVRLVIARTLGIRRRLPGVV